MRLQDWRSRSIAAAYVKILRQMRSGQGEEEHTMKVTNQRRTWCLKSEGRKDWKTCNSVPNKRGPKVLGCHGGGWVQCPLLAGGLGSVLQSACTRLISVGPGCVGGSCWGSCTCWAYLL